jgi:hypothetical protein
MRTQFFRLLATTALLGLGATPARAQNTTIDSRWLAYLGCWEALDTPSTLCLIPSADTSAVDLVTIKNGQVVTAEQILATGARVETARTECTGWHSAEWSAVSDRLYLRSEETCPGWGTRTGTGVIALSRDGQLLYIQGSTVGLRAGVRAQRYREITTTVDLPSEVRDALDALRPDLTASMQARAAATAPLAIEDLVEATRQLDVDVVEAWLVERSGSFTLDAARLTTLAKAGVPSRITDLMIALSYPKMFAINATSHQGERRVITDESYAGGASYPLTPSYGDCLTAYPPFGYSSYYCDGFAGLYPYGYSWFPYNYPLAIVYTGGSSGGVGGTTHGRVVNGRGYEEGPRPDADVVSRWGEPRSEGASSTGASRPSSTSSSSSGEQRTAKPRP